MRIVLVGAGGHASDVLGVIEALELAAEVGIAVDGDADLSRFRTRGVRQWGEIDEIGELGATHFVLGIGYSQPRRKVAARIAQCGLDPLTLVHPRAWVHSTATLGAGSVVLAGGVVSAMASLGEQSCVHHNSVVGHDARLGAFVTILPGATVSGDTAIGDAALIGSGAVVIEKRKVGERAFVGAGAVVTRDVADGVTVKGVPARS